VEVRDFVLWLRSARKATPRRSSDHPPPGSLNPKTGKRYLTNGFAPTTINHNLAVINALYAYAISSGQGPLLNPVPARTSTSRGRAAAHHGPLEPFPAQRRAAYRQRVPTLLPRAIPDDLFNEPFAAMPSDRDRALLALYVATGARAVELLGIHGAHLDYGEQLVAVVRKALVRCSGYRPRRMRSCGCGSTSRTCRTPVGAPISRCGGLCGAPTGR
jgi:integrase